MKKIAIIFFFLFSLSTTAQNWNVFNKNYRCNYKYDYSQLISNVLFMENVAVVGSDTIYDINKIGVVSGTLLTSNVPQFLMRKIIKQANGIVKLQDTTNITIIPNCTLNQTWLFDSNYNLTATCVATTTQTIFNISDSIKVIIVNNVDTVILSKQFGIVQFPKLYAQNKYYRLVGIENRTSYDLNALYGLKLVNAWDFYDYYIGFQQCYYMEWNHGDPSIPNNQGCETATQVIKTKTITPTGYIYNIDKWYIKSPFSGYCSYSLASTTFTNTNLQCDPLNGYSEENNYYPGMVVGAPFNGSAKLVKLGIDNFGRIYKYVGPSCYALTTGMPNQNEPSGGFSSIGPNTYSYQANAMMFDRAWAAGLGKLNDNTDCLCFYRYCATCAGTVGFEDLQRDQVSGLYPNPSDSKINLPIDKGTIKIFDSYGKLVKDEMFENRTAIVSELPAGIYFIEIQSDSFKSTQKLIIQH